MDNQDDASRPLLNIVRTLRDIPDRGEPCDREITKDGLEILLYMNNADKRNQKRKKRGRSRKNQKRRKNR